MIQAAVGLAGGYLRRSTDRFTLQVEPDLPRVRGHAQRLEQALLNLLINACQALPDRSRGIDLQACRAKSGREAIIRIADEGCGIRRRGAAPRSRKGSSPPGGRREAPAWVCSSRIPSSPSTTARSACLRCPASGTVATVTLPAEADP